MDWKWVLKTAGVSLGAGVAAGMIADRIIFWKKNREEWDDFEDYISDYVSEGEGDWPDIPEGVNENAPVAVPVSTEPPELYQKPDLSKLVDYTNFSRGSDHDGDAGVPDLPGVEIISSDEFVKGTGNLDGYVSVTGTWFAQDNILAGWDSDLEEKDPASTVGEKTVELFEDPDVEAVYVKNDVLKVLFEIVRSNDPYELAVQEALVMDAANPSYSSEG